MRVIGLQLDCVWENKEANHLKVLSLLERARPAPGTLVVLPEMFATGFSMNVEGIDDTRSRETQDFLARAASEYKIYLAGGVVTTIEGGRGLNQCVVYSPYGRELARYSKMQPFTLGGESDNYAAGREPVVFKCDDFNVAPFICYDLRFPEIFRSAVVRGANLFLVIASWPVMREDHWVSLLKARAIENQSFVIGVNRCGDDPKLHHSGRSSIFDPGGKLLADAGNDEGWFDARLSLQDLTDYRKQLPFLEDIRDDYVNIRQN
jgi:predicted amidohydrolase